MEHRGFGPAGDTPHRRWKRLFCASGVAGVVAAASALALLEAQGCSPAVTANPDEQSDNTIGAYCDQILPTFCSYAVGTCGTGTTEARCVADARPICCQGACSRPARLADGKSIARCLQAYAGSDGGVDDAGAAQDASAGLPCNQVQAGLAPAECQEVVELLSRPGLATGTSPGLTEAVARGARGFGRPSGLR
jgi:hypothetical protein